MNNKIGKIYSNILIHSPSWVGDTIMSLPAMRALRTNFPDAKITVIAKTHISKLFEKRDLIDDVIYLPAPNDVPGELRLRKDLKKGKYDLGVIFPNSFISALRIFGSGIDERIGYANEGRSFMLTKSVKRTTEILNKHMAYYYLNILTLIGIHSDDVSVNLSLTDSAISFAQNFINEKRKDNNSRLIALGIGSAGGELKRWGANNYIKLANTLTKDYDSEIVLICAPNEINLAYEISEGMEDRPIIPIERMTTVTQDCAIIKLCDYFIGNDSGSMHLAYAVNTTTIGLFFSTSPKNNYPLGEKSYYIHNKEVFSKLSKNMGNIDKLRDSITPDMVIDKLKEIGLL